MNKKMKKLLAGIIGIGLIILLLNFVNSLTGNPVSSAWAKKAARQYINTNYSELDVEVESCGYNFKFGHYFVFVQSPTSMDTGFAVNVDSWGNVISDTYEYEIENNFTTYRRLDLELRGIAEETIGKKLDEDINHISLSFIEDDDWLTKFTRDMTLDIHQPPLPLRINADLFSDDVSYKKIAEAAKSLETLLKAEGIPVAEYSIHMIPLSDKPAREDQSATWVNSLSVDEFPAEQMDEEDLWRVMEEFEANRVAEIDEKGKEKIME